MLVAAAYLHDIGYAEPLVDTGFHPVDGARYLRSLGLDDLACLVAHHTGAPFEADLRGLAEHLQRVPSTHRAGRRCPDLLRRHVQITGQPMQPGDRLEEIVERHGEDSTVVRSRAHARPEIYGMVARTLRRATRAQPPPVPMMISPVRLGCSTLVRIQGDLTHTTAGQAAAALRQVLDQEPHAVLIDLALLTGLDEAGADAITAQRSPGTPITLIDPRARDRAILENTRLPIAYGLEAALAPHCTTTRMPPQSSN